MRYEFFKKEAPLLLLCIITLKSFIHPSFVDVAGILATAALLAYFKWFEENKEDTINDEVKRQISAMKDDILSTRQKVDNLSLASSFRKL